jgi:hypothetical protein
MRWGGGLLLMIQDTGGDTEAAIGAREFSSATAVPLQPHESPGMSIIAAGPSLNPIWPSF